jgi:hypothetical protein
VAAVPVDAMDVGPDLEWLLWHGHPSSGFPGC